MVERYNQTLLSMLSNVTSKKQNDQNICIRPCLFAYNSSKNETTGYLSFYLMNLRDTNLSIDLNLLHETSQYMDVPDYVKTLKERMKEVYYKAELRMKHG